jgi:hypothetical protein
MQQKRDWQQILRQHVTTGVCHVNLENLHIAMTGFHAKYPPKPSITGYPHHYQ